MDNVSVLVSIERYEELLKKEERINTLDRMLKAGRYIIMEDVSSILEISKKEDTTNESN